MLFAFANAASGLSQSEVIALITTAITLMVTTAGTLLAQLISIRRHDRNSKAQIELFRLEAEQRREDARLLLAQTHAESEFLAKSTALSAKALADRTEINKHELKHELKKEIELREASAVSQTEEIKGLVITGNVLTEQGTQAAKDAFHVANSMNEWRVAMDKKLNDLSLSVHDLAESVKTILKKQDNPKR